jgi:hypothetical protein
MTQTHDWPQAAMKYDLEVREDGRLEFGVPLAAGAKVVVFVVSKEDEAGDDLVAAAGSSLGFWDNPMDDEDWNAP